MGTWLELLIQISEFKIPAKVCTFQNNSVLEIDSNFSVKTLRGFLRYAALGAPTKRIHVSTQNKFYLDLLFPRTCI